MQLESRKLLIDMRDSAQMILFITQNKTYLDLSTDTALKWAVERGFEIVGEALSQLNKIDPAIAQTITDWRKVIGFRNALIHGYSKIRNNITWDIVERELPLLLREVERLLQQPDTPQ